MHGWTGKILDVDLKEGRILHAEIPRELLYAYLGGRGLGVRLLRDGFRHDPLAADTPLVFATGPLCGTGAPTSARLSVVSRSPLTGTVFDGSVGGQFALKLKASGLDAVFITGRSPKPVVLSIQGDTAELLSAEDLWGKTVTETIAALAPRGSSAVIGPAGEHQVRFATIVAQEGGSLGRGGLGAVMGAKQLKAIVADGDNKVTPAHPERFSSAVADLLRLLRASPVIFGEFGFAEYGTAALVDVMHERRMTPTRNFQATVFEDAVDYAGPALRRELGAIGHACSDCPIGCHRRQSDGRALPEYEALSHFGALNGMHDLDAIVRANEQCNELGLDATSAAATLAAWGEARGYFATAEELPVLLEDIAAWRNDGAKLALGSSQLCQSLGRPELSMSVKHLEIPAYDPRGAYGLALAYATSNCGACHSRAFPIAHEILRKPVATDRFSFSGKARMVKNAEDSHATVDSLAACKFSLFGASLEEFAELLSATTGIEYPTTALESIGERIYLTERFYNCENGFSAKDDRLPERFFAEPGSSGAGISLPALDRQRFDEELQKYYRIRGLTEEGRFSDASFLERQP